MQRNRETATFVNKSERFSLKKKDYSKQFSHVYSSRLKIIGDLLKKQIQDRWNNKFPIKQLHELREDEQTTCIIIGTVFKQQTFKPSILKEISEEHQLVPQPKRENYTDDSDKLILEDDIQRVSLVGKIPIDELVTGVVVAVKGYVECDGRFEVEEYIFHDLSPAEPMAPLQEDRYVMLLSGLKMGSLEYSPQRIEILKYWLFGNFPIHHIDPARIVRIIIAGNSVCSTDEKARLAAYTKQQDTEILHSIKALDNFLANLAKSIPVDLMPGDKDLTNLMMPQQPLHACMFTEAKNSTNFTPVTNPYTFEIDGRRFLGTSGQNIKDIQRNSKIQSSMEALKSTLKWSHLSPTSPDTLPSYPYYNQDPFIIDQTPHIYFAGNCDEYSTEIFKNDQNTEIRVISVPQFETLGEVVLVNLKNFECKKMIFDVEADDDDE